MLSPFFASNRVLAIAHRGGARLRPENTLPAFAHAVSLGVDAIELDVRLSRDGHPVVIHDAQLDRTTEQAETCIIDDVLHLHPFGGQGRGDTVGGAGLLQIACDHDRRSAAASSDSPSPSGGGVT